MFFEAVPHNKMCARNADIITHVIPLNFRLQKKK